MQVQRRLEETKGIEEMLRERWKEEQRINITTNSNVASRTNTTEEEDSEDIISENNYFVEDDELRDLLESTSSNKQ